MNVAVYPGSFDPVTFGHLDIVRRAAGVFDRLIIAVLANPRKTTLLGVEDRIEIVRRSLDGSVAGASDRITVEAFDGLTVDLCRARGARFIVRGLRAISDFESEPARHARRAPRKWTPSFHDARAGYELQP
jgi:pantetheine-phosphate adenylyltransferase